MTIGYLSFLPLVAFAIVLVYLHKRDGTILSFSSFIVAIYLISFALSPILDLVFASSEYKLTSSLYFIVVNMLFILPLLKIKGDKPIYVQGNDRIIFPIAMIYAFLGIASLIYYTPSIITALRGSIVANRILANKEAFVSTRGIFALLFSLIANSFIYNLFFYFYSVYKKWPNVFSNLLLVSSLSFVALSSAWVGRDGFVLWTLTYISIFLLFRWNLDRITRRSLLKTASIIFAPGFLLLCLVTFSRFSNSETYNRNIALAIIDYTGQQYRNFSFQYNTPELEPEIYTFNGTRAILTKLNLIDKSDSDTGNKEFLQRYYDTSLNVFSGFVGSIRSNFGNLITFIIGIVWMLIFSHFKNMERFSILFIYVFFYQILLHGVFYFRQGLGYCDLIFYQTICLYIIYDVIDLKLYKIDGILYLSNLKS